MTQTQINMVTLYERLSTLGFPKSFIQQKALPDWWDVEFEATNGAVVEAAAYISRRLNLDISSLLQPDRVPAFKESSQAKFKVKEGTEIKQLLVSQSLANRVAEMVAYASIPECKELPESAKQIRDRILAKQSYVNLETLLEFFWDYGIPVVHFDDFPKARGVRKFDGMVAYFYNRPVVIISFKHRSMARLLFIIAHELGHIIKGHVNGISLVDEEIDPENIDMEEIEANEFAVELLVGKPDMGYYTPRIFTGEKLASYAQEISIRDRVDPGVVVLNYAWSKANLAKTTRARQIIWATAYKALKLIEGDGDAPKSINRYIQEYLDLDRLDEDSQDYLELVTMR